MARSQVLDAPTIHLRWPRDPGVPASANLFVIQATPSGEVVLTFGNSSPIFVGTPEEQLKQAREFEKEGLDVAVVGRVVMSWHNIRELHKVLESQLKGQSS